jgi:hypothetical protein
MGRVMLTALQALEAAKAHGAVLQLDDDGRPRLLNAHSLPLTILDALKANRQEVIDLLAKSPPDAPILAAPAAVLLPDPPQGTPTVWVAGVRVILAMQPPPHVSAHKWGDVKRAAERLVTEGWCATAAALGWPPQALFGCDQLAPHARFDLQGFAWLLLPSDRVHSIDADGCQIITRAGAGQRFYRSPHQEAACVLPWSPYFEATA